MFKSIFKYIFLGGFWIFLAVLVSPAGMAQIDDYTKDGETIKQQQGYDWQDTLERVNLETEYNLDAGEPDLVSIIASIIKIILSLVGVIFVVLLIYAGYLWMVAGGNEEQITKAKMIIKNSLIGLIIVLSAYAITYFAIEKLVEATQEEYQHRTGLYIK